MFERIRHAVESEAANSPKAYAKEMKSYSAEFTADLRRRIDNHEFSTIPELTTRVAFLMDQIRYANPALLPEPISVLISKDPSVNASSIGYQTIILNTGLLLALRSSEDLLFVLGHEMGHDLLDHRTQMRNHALEQYASREHKAEVKEILKTAESKRETLLGYFEELELETKSYSQSFEFEADSMALLLIASANGNQRAGISALRHIEDYHPPSPDWKTVFHFEHYPFQTKWLYAPTLLVQPDTIDAERIALLSTHPHVEARIEKLETAIGMGERERDSTALLTDALVDTILVETVSFLFDQKAYVSALHTALSYGSEPQESICYLVGATFNKLYLLRELHQFNESVPVPPAIIENAYDELILILNNMRITELARTGYYFMDQYPFTSERYLNLKSRLKEQSKLN